MFGYILLFLVVLNVADLSLYFLVKKIVTQGVERELSLSTDGIVKQIKTTADVTIRNHLRAISEVNFQTVKRNYEQYQQGHLSEEQAKQQAFDQLVYQTIGDSGYPYVVDSKGYIQVHPKAKLVNSNLAKYDFIQQQMHTKSGYLEYDWKNPGEKYLRPKALHMIYFEPWDWIISSSSYREEFNKLINIDDFKNSVLDVKLGETGYTYLIDSKGNVIIHPFIQGNFYHAVDSNGYEFVKDILEKKTGIIYYTWKNPQENDYREKLAKFHYLEDFDWYIISSTYTDELYQPIDKLTQVNLAILVISIFIVIPCTLLLSSSIVNPLNRIMKKIQQASDNNYSIRINESNPSGDELATLANYFNQFMSELETSNKELHNEIDERILAQEKQAKLNDELEQLNRNLENRVKQRTNALQESMEKLTTMQKKLVETEKMASMGNLVSGVAHELNTPLGSAITLTSFLLEQTNKIGHKIDQNQLKKNDLMDFIANTQDSFNIVSDNLSRISELINKFKLISINEDYGSQASFNLAQLLSEITGSMRNKIYDISLDINVDSSLNLYSYPQVFHNIFSELINNSLTHGFSEQKVRIISISQRIEGDNLIIDYQDNGNGVNDELVDTLFEPFITSNRSDGNAGLGMHYLYNLIAKKLNGEITIVKEKTYGFHVAISLPISIIDNKTTS